MAYDLRFVDPYHMLSLIPNWMVNQWKAWYEVHHLLGNDADPEYRSDTRMALGFAKLANHWREKNPVQIDDFLPFPPPKPAQSAEQLQAAFSAAADASQNAKIRRKLQTLKEAEFHGGTKSKNRSKTSYGSRRVQKGSNHSSGRAIGVREGAGDI